MITTAQKISLVVAACGGAAGLAQAQPFAVNGSGATLLEALFRAPAATLDFIDADGDGFVQEQLAPFDASSPFISSQQWQFTYRIVGSGNGFAEMRDWGTVFATAPDGDAANLSFNSSDADGSVFNGNSTFVSAGVTQGVANTANPGATPFRTLDDGSYAITTGTGAGTGIQIDFSALDVPVSWFVINDSGAPQFNRVPGAPGYGDNPRPATDRDGAVISQGNKLKTLVSPNGVTLNTNVSSPDANTVFDTPVTLTPVAAPVNFGAGLQQIEMSDLRHLNATGRRMNGENLMVVTRDSGSGTRNAFMNGICLDPSWGVGENIGPKTSSSTNDVLGANFQPSNKGGSSRMEATVKNHRLAVGHTGAERGESKGWLVDGELELLAVRADLRGGTVFARPTIGNVVDGGPDGYNIQGLGGIATIGDPRSAPAALGGWGWDASEVGANPNPVQPMRNEQAAAYVNNITRSIAAVTAVPSDPANAFSPGEFLGLQFVLPATSFNVPETNPDASEICIPIIANAERNDVLTQFVLNDPNNVLALPDYASFNTDSAGLVPTRTFGAGISYSDGATENDQFYIAVDGTEIDYGTRVGDTDFNTTVDNPRNKIAGDFDGDGDRDADDVTELVAAWSFRHAGGSWDGGPLSPVGQRGRACPEILGDFDGDGNFDDADVRYWADGLHLVGGLLDRDAGFTGVDAAFGGNFFGTTLVTGTYDNGDSKADIAGNATTRGFKPSGSDGVVDVADIDYICANFGDWMDLGDAVNIDLSADMNGDMMVNLDDVIEVVEGVLDSTQGDVNLDGVVDATDLAIANGNLGNPGGYGDGDVNCDGVVDAADIAIIDPAAPCPADLFPVGAGDGQLNFLDLGQYLNLFGAQDPSADLFPAGLPDGQFNFLDLGEYLNLFGQGCP